MMYSKEQQLKSTRIKPKRRNVTKITQKARNEVYRRSNQCCERCGKHSKWGMQVAHLESAGHMGSGSQASNLMLLCGPSTQTGTCHHWVDSTAEGREWKKQAKVALEQYYKGDGWND